MDSYSCHRNRKARATDVNRFFFLFLKENEALVTVLRTKDKGEAAVQDDSDIQREHISF